MNPKSSTWIETAAAVAVLIGLLFVAQELRQNNEYARADSIRDLHRFWSEIYQFGAEQDIDALMQQSIDDPNQLTDDELRLLDSYYWMIMNAEWAQDTMAEYGLTMGRQEEFRRLIAQSYFTSEFGRAWFDLNEAECRLHSEAICDVIAEVIRSEPVVRKGTYYRDLRSRFGSGRQ